MNNKKTYERPWTMAEIEMNLGPVVAKRLSQDPVHCWRAKTGIELIHREPSEEELDRIWANWKLMDDEMKEISDMKSFMFFGCSNREHYRRLKARSRTVRETRP